MEPLVCPKCRGTMRQYERSGVVVDQCEQCQGLFLDRGELEKLTQAEAAYYSQPPAQQAPPPAGYGDQRGYPPPPGGFLGGLFGGHGGGRYRGGHH